MSRSRDEQLAYQRGYAAGVAGRWPDHKPPLPPEPVLRQLIEAARKLRSAADSACATLDDGDEFVRQFDPGIEALDDAMRAVTAWLKQKEDTP